jgi:hypothetical protein
MYSCYSLLAFPFVDNQKKNCGLIVLMSRIGDSTSSLSCAPSHSQSLIIPPVGQVGVRSDWVISPIFITALGDLLVWDSWDASCSVDCLGTRFSAGGR